MARAQLKHTIRDRAGSVVQNALCYVYETGTTTAVTDLFAAKTGGSAISGAVLTSNAQGEIEGWLTTARQVDIYVTDNSDGAYYPSDAATLKSFTAFTEEVSVPAQYDGGSVQVDNWATGDGLTDDTLALRAAIATGKHLVFTPGKTYLTSGDLQLASGQHIYGNGAAIKRAAQVSTTTTTSIDAGVTQAITVASTTGLWVGQSITYANGATDDTNNYTITDITGSVVTIDGTFGTTVSGTTNVHTSWFTLKTAPDCRIYDLEIDGNKSNWTYARWQTTVEIQCNAPVQPDRTVVSNCYIHDAPGEGIILMGDGSCVRDNWIIDTDGNGVHLSTGTGMMVEGNRIENTNLDGETVGHNGGCVANSQTGVDSIIRGNHLLNGNSGLHLGVIAQTFVGNTVRDCTYGVHAILAVGSSSFDSCIIADNVFTDCDSVSISQNSDDGDYPSEIVFSGNSLMNTRLTMTRVANCIVEGNLIDLTGDTTNVCVYEYASQNCRISGNTLLGGVRGIDANLGTGVSISGNTVTGQTAVGINDQGTVSGRISDNFISNTASALDNYDGIIARAGAPTSGNTIVLNKGHSGIYPQATGTIVSGNYVSAGTATYSIRAGGGTSGIVMKYNDVTAAISNAGGTANTDRDNGDLL